MGVLSQMSDCIKCLWNNNVVYFIASFLKSPIPDNEIITAVFSEF